MSSKTIYRGEGLVKRWGDSSSALRTVTIQLQEDEPLSRHPFFGFEGRRVAFVVVELGEADSGPGLHSPHEGSDQGAGDSIRKDDSGKLGGSAFPPAPAPNSSVPKPNSTRAVMMAKDPLFRHWAVASNEFDADSFIKRVCKVASKADLNRPPGSTEFDRLRQQFNSWKLSQ